MSARPKPARQPITRTRMKKRPPRRLATGNPAYLEWIRSLPCVICSRLGKKQTSRTDAHHVGARGLGQKVADEQTIPLCHWEHHLFGPEAYHRMPKSFGAHHKLHIPRLIAWLQAEFERRAECN